MPRKSSPRKSSPRKSSPRKSPRNNYLVRAYAALGLKPNATRTQLQSAFWSHVDYDELAKDLKSTKTPSGKQALEKRMKKFPRQAILKMQQGKNLGEQYGVIDAALSLGIRPTDISRETLEVKHKRKQDAIGRKKNPDFREDQTLFEDFRTLMRAFGYWNKHGDDHWDYFTHITGIVPRLNIR